MSGERVVVAMSGGVDSSVCTYLLKQQGYEVIGMTMKIWPSTGDESKGQKSCCGSDAVRDARRVAEIVDIPYYVMDMVEEFDHAVIDNFVGEYRSGRTPNPCIRCNIDLKFGTLMSRATKVGAAKVATGHYARLLKHPATGRYTIGRALHDEKDQSYTLYGLSQEQLSRALFPLGDMTKEEVRRIAGELGLPTADKPESQDICFVSTNYRDFLKGRDKDPLPSGKFVDVRGEVLGEHEGITHYTVGQRRGLGGGFPKPMYVVRVDPATNTVVLGDRRDLMQTVFEVDPVNWVGVDRPGGGISCRIKVRYGGPERRGVVEATAGGARVTLEEPHRAVTPGQSAVFYDETGLVLGGGLIAAPLVEIRSHVDPAPGARAMEKQG